MSVSYIRERRLLISGIVELSSLPVEEY
jgi:hypothetical protein